MKFLGLVFDRLLTFRAHVKYLKTVCDKSLDVLRVVGHTDWGADKVVLLGLYCAPVRSKLDNSCIVYSSASTENITCSSPCRFTHLSGSFSYFPGAKSLRQSGRSLYLCDV